MSVSASAETLTQKGHGRQMSNLAHLQRFAARLESENGQALMEYALVLALVAIVSIGVLKAMGVDIHNVLDQTSSSMASVPNP